MSAKHRRPFFVFAAVAVICSMVLITGVRSKAEDSPARRYDAARSFTPGVTIARLPETPGLTTASHGEQTPAGVLEGAQEGPEVAGSDGALEVPPGGGGDGRSAGPDSAVNDLLTETVRTDPEVGAPSDPDEVPGPPEDSAKSTTPKARAAHGKNDKADNSNDKGNKGNDKGEKGPQDGAPVGGPPAEPGDKSDDVPGGDE